MKKTFIFISFIIFGSTAFSQLTTQVSSEKWITTAVDTFQYTTQSITPAHLTITSDSLSDNILQYRTSLQATWRSLLPDDAAYTFPATKGLKVFRKASKDSVYSRAWSD